MKKNITVNICGFLCPIDEDAYRLLECYMTNIRSYFHDKDGDEEVADDIEARVAELMAELSDNGSRPVNIDMVREIISRIGEPGSDWECADGNPDGCVPPGVEDITIVSAPRRRKLYRDIDNKMLGGVASGLACYLGLNVMWIRIAILILALCSFGTVAVVYLLCWLLIPAAETPAQRLEMQGEPVTISNLRDEILGGARSAVNAVKDRRDENWLNKGLRLISSLCKILLLTVGTGVLVAFGIALISVIIFMFVALLTPSTEIIRWADGDVPFGNLLAGDYNLLFWGGVISLIIFLALSLFMGIHLLMRLVGSTPRMSFGVKCACIAGWVLSLVAVSSIAVRSASIAAFEWERNAEKREIERIRHKEEKRDKSLALLATDGWTVKADSIPAGAEFTETGRHFSGNKKRWYIHVSSKNGSRVANVMKQVKVAPGKYRLTAMARTNGSGCAVYVIGGDNVTRESFVPVCGSKGGSVWADAGRMLAGDSVNVPDGMRARLNDIAQANDGNGYGWSEVRIDNIIVGRDSLVTYGVTNEGTTRSWDGTWFSATGFELQRVK